MAEAEVETAETEAEAEEGKKLKDKAGFGIIIKIDKISNKDKFKEFAGMWKGRDTSIENIREKAWKK